MQKKYYKNYLLNEKDEIAISELAEVQSYVTAYHNDKLDCMVSERINYSGVIDWIIYYSDKSEKIILNFHQSLNKEIDMVSIFYRKPNGFILSNYKNTECTSYFIKTYDKLGLSKLTQEFNADFELVEYRQSIYDKEGRHIEEKIFFADSWTIHNEPMD